MFTRDTDRGKWRWQDDHVLAVTNLNEQSMEEIVALIPALVKLRDYYQKYPDRWIQTELARVWDEEKNECGTQCHWADPKADCFCIVGGMAHFRFPHVADPSRHEDVTVYELPLTLIVASLISGAMDGYTVPTDTGNRVWQLNDRVFHTPYEVITFIDHVIDELTLYINNHGDSATATEGATV